MSAFSAGEDTPVCNVHEIGSVNLKVLPALAMALIPVRNLATWGRFTKHCHRT